MMKAVHLIILSATAWLGLAAGVAVAAPPGTHPHESWMPADVDWREAVEVVVELQDNFFEPGNLIFAQGIPYKLVLRNVGDRPHDMVDDHFFHNVVIKRIVSDSGSVITPHIHSLYIQPGKEATVYFVAVHAGASEFFCSLPGHREDGMEGQIRLEERP